MTKSTDCDDTLLIASNSEADSCLSVESPLRLMQSIDPEPADPKPMISVIVCAYRHEEYIEQCLRSISNEILQSLEVLIIDDGSPDETLRKCLGFQFRQGVAVRVYTKPNLGLVHSLRYGLELARGRYVAFMASDDCYVDGGLNSALSFLMQNPSIDALLCQAVTLDIRESLVYGPRMDVLFELSPFERLDEILISYPRPMLLQATIFKTDFIRGLKPWADKLELDDWPTFIRLFVAEAQHNAVVRYESTIRLCKYRIHEGGIHAQLDRQLRITEQVARSFVPIKYRSICLANVRINNGLIDLYQGRWSKGLTMCLRGFLTHPSLTVLKPILQRAWRFLSSRFRLIWQKNQ